MSDIFNIHYTKTHLSSLLRKVESGEEIVIGRAGRPIARILRYEPVSPKRKLGQWAGQFEASPDFDDEDPRIQAMFEGRSAADGGS